MIGKVGESSQVKSRGEKTHVVHEPLAPEDVCEEPRSIVDADTALFLRLSLKTQAIDQHTCIAMHMREHKRYRTIFFPFLSYTARKF